MLKRFLFTMISLVIAIQLAGCGGISVKKPASPIKKVAIASFSVSDYGGSVRGGSVGRDSVVKLMQKNVSSLLSSTEKALSKRFKVKKVSTFVGKKAYKKLASKKVLNVITPKVGRKSMPVFTTVSGEIKGGTIKSETAIKLCKALKVDAIVLIFSEWTIRTGGFIPLTKSLTKNVFTMWDRDGNLIAKKRIDKIGQKTLGAMGIKAVNKSTITEWGDSTRRALDEIISSPEVQGLAG